MLDARSSTLCFEQYDLHEWEARRMGSFHLLCSGRDGTNANEEEGLQRMHLAQFAVLLRLTR